MVMYVDRNESTVNNFVSLKIKLVLKMMMKVTQLEMCHLPNDRHTAETYLRDTVTPRSGLDGDHHHVHT